VYRNLSDDVYAKNGAQGKLSERIKAMKSKLKKHLDDNSEIPEGKLENVAKIRPEVITRLNGSEPMYIFFERLICVSSLGCCCSKPDKYSTARLDYSNKVSQQQMTTLLDLYCYDALTSQAEERKKTK